MTRTLRLILVAAILPLSAQSSASDPAVVTVALSNFRFSPHALHLRAGVPIVLRLHNSAGGGHNFSAPQFFGAARMSPSTASVIHNGTVEVPKHTTVDISLVPAGGSYRLRCSHTLHSAFGMKGVIRVD